MPVGAAIGSAVGSAANGILGGSAAGSAAKAGEQAGAADSAYAQGIYNQASSNLNPTIQSGISSGNELSGLLGTGGDAASSQAAFNKYLDSTNYKFQLDQGLNGIEYANAPAFNSGATAKALNNYAQGQAGSALQGYEGLLTGQQSLGAQSALGLGNIGVGISQQVSNANNFGANAAGAGALGQANAYGNALSGVLGAGSQALTQSSFGSNSQPYTNAFSNLQSFGNTGAL